MLVSARSSASCKWKQPAITENTQQVGAAWGMKCTNYRLRVLEQGTQEPKQLGGEQRGGLKAALVRSVQIKPVRTRVLPVPDVCSVESVQMYADWVM